MTDEELQIAIDKTREFINAISQSTMQQGARADSVKHLKELEKIQLTRASVVTQQYLGVGGTD